MNRSKDRIGIIGAGVVGTALGVALAGCGYTIAGVVDISEEAARKAAKRLDGAPFSTDAATIAREADWLLLTTPDDVIGQVVTDIAASGAICRGDLVFHCSGALGADVLHPAAECGATVASMHPMGVFSDVDSAVAHLSELYFCLEGDDEAVEAAEKMVEEMGATPLLIPRALKTLTHIAACFSSNYVVTLAGSAMELLEGLPLSREEKLRMLLPLFRGAVRGLEDRGVPLALTGPIARGDVSTVRRHCEVLAADTAAARLYALLGVKTLSLAAERGGVDEPTLEKMRILLETCLTKAMPDRDRQKERGR